MTIPASVQTVINQLARERRSGTNEPLICVNVDMQQALSDLGNGILPTSIANGDIIGNNSGSAGPPGDVTPTSILDIMAGSSQGLVMYRGAAWSGLATGTAGGLLQTNGAAANPSWTTPGQIVGTNTNDNANAGNVGEYISSSIVLGSAINIASGTPTAVTSITLTAGDWDIWANPTLVAAATTVLVYEIFNISTSSAVIAYNPGMFNEQNINSTQNANGYISMPIGPFRVSIAASTTYYLNTQCGFTVSTLGAWGLLAARRRR